jgi:hypothetical protein
MRDVRRQHYILVDTSIASQNEAVAKEVEWIPEIDVVELGVSALYYSGVAGRCVWVMRVPVWQVRAGPQVCYG